MSLWSVRSLRVVPRALALALLAMLAACSTLEGTQRPTGSSRPNGAGAPGPGGGAGSPAPPESPPPSVAAPARPPSETSGATQALLAQSRAARAAGNYDQANATIERALRIAPSDASLWVELGEIELATGETQQAATLARKALTLAADDRSVAAQAERLLPRGGQALSALREASATSGHGRGTVFQRSVCRPRPAPLRPRRYGVLRAGGCRRDILLRVRAIPAGDRAAGRAAHDAAAAARIVGADLLAPWLGGHVGRKRVVVLGCVLQAFLWLPILLVPVLFRGHAATALLILLSALFQREQPRDPAVDEHHARPRLRAAARTVLRLPAQLTTITTFVALVGCGVMLHELDTSGATYLGFVLIFAVAFVARLVSAYHLTFLFEPAAHDPNARHAIEHWWRSLLSTGAIGFSSYFALMNAAVGISARSSPFHAARPEAELSRIHRALGHERVRSVSDAQHLGRLADVYGNRLVLIVTSISLPVDSAALAALG